MPTSMRTTRQRSAVVAQLAQTKDFISAQELYSRLRLAGERVGLSTVYRTVQSLAASDEVDVIISAEGEARYRACAPSQVGHHHHLVCRRCGRAVEVNNPAVERWADEVGLDNGFRDVTHTLEIFGVCQSCAD